MAHYTKSRVVSVRMEQELFDAVRRRARAEGRSVSGQVVFLVRDRVKAEATRPNRRPITGWLRHLAAPHSHAEFLRGRKQASAELLEAVRRKVRVT